VNYHASRRTASCGGGGGAQSDTAHPRAFCYGAVLTEVIFSYLILFFQSHFKSVFFNSTDLYSSEQCNSVVFWKYLVRISGSYSFWVLCFFPFMWTNFVIVRILPVPSSRIRGTVPPPPIRLNGVVLKHRDDFTFMYFNRRDCGSLLTTDFLYMHSKASSRSTFISPMRFADYPSSYLK
jgi:hypothetical protein